MRSGDLFPKRRRRNRRPPYTSAKARSFRRYRGSSYYFEFFARPLHSKPSRTYIPNPQRCFQCQRFGHSKTVCRGQPTCSRCAEVDHDSADCKAKERCVNCKGDHSSFLALVQPGYSKRRITALKIKNKISYPQARRVVSSRTPVAGKSMRWRPANPTYPQPFK
ncbi:hypothetical protein TNCV_177861 [Trichonephila clavipes]|nr:hypothetical protein TNCV_177861 [Trichonephila clavipes]